MSCTATIDPADRPESLLAHRTFHGRPSHVSRQTYRHIHQLPHSPSSSDRSKHNLSRQCLTHHPPSYSFPFHFSSCSPQSLASPTAKSLAHQPTTNGNYPMDRKQFPSNSPTSAPTSTPSPLTSHSGPKLNCFTALLELLLAFSVAESMTNRAFRRQCVITSSLGALTTMIIGLVITLRNGE